MQDRRPLTTVVMNLTDDLRAAQLGIKTSLWDRLMPDSKVKGGAVIERLAGLRPVSLSATNARSTHASHRSTSVTSHYS